MRLRGYSRTPCKFGGSNPRRSTSGPAGLENWPGGGYDRGTFRFVGICWNDVRGRSACVHFLASSWLRELHREGMVCKSLYINPIPLPEGRICEDEV